MKKIGKNLNEIKFILLLCIVFLKATESTGQDNITIDGIERTYIVHVPKKYNKLVKLPLVIALHGGGGKAKSMNKLTGFNTVADKYLFIVVYPDGIDKNWNDGREITKKFVNGKEVDDVKFISCLIDSLIKKYIIDSSRIFITGISNGGIMSFRLACELSDKIAGIASVASSMTEEQYKNCGNPSLRNKPSRSIPVMIIFGDADPLVPFEGGEIFGKRGKVVAVSETVKFWVKNNGCSDIPVEEISVDSNDDETKAEKFTYKGNAEVIYWLIQGGGHTWPGGWQYLPSFLVGKTSQEIKASEEIWKFFSDKKLVSN